MTETYLVELVTGTPWRNNGGTLHRYTVEAGTAHHAYDMVRELLGLRKIDVMAGYVTADPYKVTLVRSGRHLWDLSV
jgi:hypothetical protein